VQFVDSRPLVVLNVVVGIGCWSFLAVVLGRHFRHPLVRVSAFLGVLVLSLSPEISGWDAALLSGSISASVTALCVALAFLFAEKPSSSRAALLSGALAVTCLARETNALMALLLLVGVALIVRRNRRIVALGLLAGLLATAWGQHASDQRWEIPLRNSVAVAIQDHGAGPWFQRHGMPLDRATVPLLLERPTIRFMTDPRARQLRSWLDTRGRSAWYRYLVSHPGYALRPVVRPEDVVDGQPAQISPYLEHSPPLTNIGYVHGRALALLAAAAGALLVVRRRPALAVAAAVLLAAIPVLLVIPNLDPIDVQRHANGSQILVRLGLGLLMLAGADALIAKGLRSRARRDASDRGRTADAQVAPSA
jgi:hypothetical protein